MARPGKDYCCCCIPLRFAVGIISLIALFLGAANLWSVRSGTNDGTSKTSAYITAAVYAVLGLSGLLSAFFKTYSFAKNFSTLWWTVTTVVSILAVINVVLLGTREKVTLRGVCQDTLLTTPKYSSGNYNLLDLNKDIDSCYRSVMLVAGISLAVQVIVMSICGWVASRYTGEVKHMHDGQTHSYSHTLLPYQAPYDQHQPQHQPQPQQQQHQGQPGYYKS